MKIRDHPNLLHWPPEWTASFGNESLPSDRREELVLREVELLSTTLHDYHCYIRILAENRMQPWKTLRPHQNLENLHRHKNGENLQQHNNFFERPRIS